MSVWSCEMNRRRFLNLKKIILPLILLFKKIVDIYDVQFLYYVFSLTEIPRNNIIPLFLQSRHDFMVRAAQPFKTRYELILKSSKQQRTKQKAEKIQNEKKRKGIVCLFAWVCICVFVARRVPRCLRGQLRGEKRILSTKSSIWLAVKQRFAVG